MKNSIKIFLAIAIFIATFNLAYSQATFPGTYFLEKVATATRDHTPNQIMDFNADGTVYLQKYPLGTWTKKGDNINISGEDINGNYKVTVAGETTILTSEKDTLFLIQLDLEQMESIHKNSGLVGTWQLANSPNKMIQLVFELPFEFTYFEKEDGMETTYRGLWWYRADKGMLLTSPSDTPIKGFSDVVEFNKDEIILSNQAQEYVFQRKESEPIIEKLTFEEAEFYNENGESRYYDTNKLPWSNQSIYAFQNLFADTEKLVYSFQNYIEETKTFETKTLTALLGVDMSDENLRIYFDYIFYGYDQFQLPEDTQLPPNNLDAYNPLFPYEDIIFRVVGVETIEVPAGSFECTVVEGFGSFDQKVKLWMSNDLAGFYVKIIQQKEGNFGYYNLYQLQEIIYK